MNYFIYLYIYFFGYFKGKYSFVFRYFETVRSCWSSFFSFFFNYLGTNRIESLGNFANEISRLFNLILIRVKFFFFFFFFFQISRNRYVYIYKFEIFHINNIPYRHAFEIFEISRFTREDWNLNNSILYSAISLQIFSTKYSDIII